MKMTDAAKAENETPAAAVEADAGKKTQAEPKDERNHKPFSKGFLKHNITLTNGRTINVMNFAFRRAAVAFYNIAVILQIIARDEKSKAMVEDAHNFLIATSDNLNATIDEKISEVNKLCQENGISLSSWKDEMGFSHAQSWEIKVASPWAKKFLMSLQRIDEYIGILDYLWLNGLVEDRDHTRLPRQITRDILRYANMSIQMEVNAFKYINSLDSSVQQEVEDNKMTEQDDPNSEIGPRNETEQKNLEKWAESEENA